MNYTTKEAITIIHAVTGERLKYSRMNTFNEQGVFSYKDLPNKAKRLSGADIMIACVVVCMRAHNIKGERADKMIKYMRVNQKYWLFGGDSYLLCVDGLPAIGTSGDIASWVAGNREHITWVVNLGVIAEETRRAIQYYELAK